MTFAHGSHRERQRYLRPTRLASLSALVVVSAAFLPAGAGATPSARSAAPATGATSPATGATFCQDAAKFGKSGTASFYKLKPPALMADYNDLKALNGTMPPVTPTAIRSNLEKIFAFDLGLFVELKKVGWTFANIPKSVLAEWAVAGPKLTPASADVVGYMNSDCHLKLFVP